MMALVAVVSAFLRTCMTMPHVPFFEDFRGQLRGNTYTALPASGPDLFRHLLAKASWLCVLRDAIRRGGTLNPVPKQVQHWPSFSSWRIRLALVVSEMLQKCVNFNHPPLPFPKQQCFCDDKDFSAEVGYGGCDVRCAGNKQETCGG